MINNQLELLATSWSMTSSGYNELLVPRFSPWTNDVLKAVAEELPKSNNGNIMAKGHRSCCVPCCGPGQELLPLSHLLGSKWSVLGIHLAPGMIDIAKERVVDHPRVDAIVGDCGSVLPGDVPYDMIVSIFGFQQMSDPLSVLQVWLDALSLENGLLVLCFWPSGIEEEEEDFNSSAPTARPFSKFREAVQQRLGTSSNNDTEDGEISWDDQVVRQVKELAHVNVVKDVYISHDIEWESVDQFWNAFTKAGPWHIMRLRRGNDFVEGLKDDVCAAFDEDGLVVHRARARLLILRRKQSLP